MMSSVSASDGFVGGFLISVSAGCSWVSTSDWFVSVSAGWVSTSDCMVCFCISWMVATSNCYLVAGHVHLHGSLGLSEFQSLYVFIFLSPPILHEEVFL